MNTTGKLEPVDRATSAWAEILKLDELFFPRPWKGSDWETLDLAHHSIWAWTRESQIIGFALFATPKDGTAHLLKIFLMAELRGTGASEEFWQGLKQELKCRRYANIYLEVEETNVRALGFYHRVGFSPLRKLKSYYSDGSNAVAMQLIL